VPTAEEELDRLPAEWKGATLESREPTVALADIFLGPADASMAIKQWAYNFGTVAGIVFLLDGKGQAHVGAWCSHIRGDLKWFNEGQRVLTRRDAAYAWLLDAFTADADCTGLDVNVARARLEAARSRLQAFEQTGRFAPTAEPQQPFWEHVSGSSG
jgi:hypothetical protein